MKNFGYFVIFSLLLLASCSRTDLNKKTSQNYFENIASGNFNAIENYLSNDFVYEDVIFKQEYFGKADYVNSLVPDSAIHFHCDKILNVSHIDADNDSMSYVKGEYCGYTYKKREIAPKRFISVLYFDKQGKIYKQEDWIDHSLEGILNMYQFRSNLEFGN